MAKILLGATLGDIRGKQGGTVYSRNRYTNYTRQKTTPVNPRSIKQTTVRNMFGTISANWRSLTPSEQQSWINLADQVKATNVFGNSFVYTGFNVFMMGNQTLQTLGISTAVVKSAPAVPPALPNFEGVTISSTATAITAALTADGKSNVDNYFLQLQATPIVSASLSNSSVQNLYRNLTEPEWTVPTTTLTTNWEDVFGAYNNLPGQAMYMRIRYVDRASGLYGAWQVLYFEGQIPA